VRPRVLDLDGTFEFNFGFELGSELPRHKLATQTPIDGIQVGPQMSESQVPDSNFQTFFRKPSDFQTSPIAPSDVGPTFAVPMVLSAHTRYRNCVCFAGTRLRPKFRPLSGTLSHLDGRNRGSSHTLPGEPSDRVPHKNQRPTRPRVATYGGRFGTLDTEEPSLARLA
jgi:hypothetical protein